MSIKGKYFYYSGIFVFFTISLYFTISIILFQHDITKSESDFKVNNGDTVKVTSVIDGDEVGIQLAEMKFVVRILGISSFDPTANDPITQNIGQLAFSYLKSNILNKNIKVVFDEFKKDSKNRLLAYIQNDSIDVGRDMIAKGLVLVYTQFSFSRMNEYLLVEEIAKKDKVGLWSNEEISNRAKLLKNVWENDRTGK